MKNGSNSIIRQLQLVFVISIGILLISSYASFYSIQQLIENSKLVNHTNDVLYQTENIISAMKDAETGQRGFLVTFDPSFLQPYNESFINVDTSFNALKKLTTDNPAQQKNLAEVKRLIKDKYFMLQRIIHIDSIQHAIGNYTPFADNRTEMLKGKATMDTLRTVIHDMQSIEKDLLEKRMAEQTKFTTYTPILVAIAAILSILIAFFSYIRIKADMDQRIAEQLKAEEEYIETNRRIAVMEEVTQQIANGNYQVRSEDTKKDELGRISHALNEMTGALENTFNELQRATWLQAGAVEINESLRGKVEIKELAKNSLTQLVNYVDAKLGTFYVTTNDHELKLVANHAASKAPKTIQKGEGLVGQAMLDKKVVLLHNLPAGYLNITSSLGGTQPMAIVALPINYGTTLVGVIELGFLHNPGEHEMQLLKNIQEALGIGINTAYTFKQIQELLERSQAQSEELQAQHGELENLNSELEAQTQKLQASEEELRVQQEELQQTNQELEERSKTLEEKTEMILERNIEIQRKADQLALSTKYKSEFLANMSHELRTPLNSILLLSRLLSENGEGNLNTDQIEYSQVIQSSGNGLLTLIDEILDLSKIESGKMEVELTNVSIETLTNDIKGLFTPIAKEKGIKLNVTVEDGTAKAIETDKMRLEQILKNLLSNALKFTSKGSVSLSITPCEGLENFICFKVKDTGIGIAPDKQQLVFEAFQQADGSTRRKYGGTGLGLSISRELAKLLNGEIKLESETNKGSEFTLIIPVSVDAYNNNKTPLVLEQQPQPEPAKTVTPKQNNQYISSFTPEHIPDDRNNIQPGDQIILIIEDDMAFAAALLKYTNSKGFKGISAPSGDEGIELASKFNPFGILLDIQLPVKSGWEVMDDLKSNPRTRHIPVHIMSSHEVKKESLMKGAVDFINKPMAFEKMGEIFDKIERVINKKDKKVLIVEENHKHAKALSYFLQVFDINPEVKSSVKESIEAFESEHVDCVILDMGIPAEGGYDTLEMIKKTPGLENLPIIVFTGKSLSKTEEQRLKYYTDSIVIKTAHSYKRILDEVSIFLHLVEKSKPEAKQKNKYPMLGALEEVLANKTILIAEDDVRNIFSLTKVLEQHKMKVISAGDGREALDVLAANPDTSIVLMDIMMPEMDGYESMQKIRQNPKYKKLPIIAVTAKSMMGDREKCIQAGASDYISKPVDIDQLLALLRVWLYEK